MNERPSKTDRNIDEERKLLEAEIKVHEEIVENLTSATDENSKEKRNLPTFKSDLQDLKSELEELGTEKKEEQSQKSESDENSDSTPAESKEQLRTLVDQFDTSRNNPQFIKNKYIWNGKLDPEKFSSHIEEYQPNQEKNSINTESEIKETSTQPPKPDQNLTEEIQQVRKKIKDLESRVARPVPGALKENLEPEILALEDEIHVLEDMSRASIEENQPDQNLTEENQPERQRTVSPETSPASLESKEKIRVAHSLEWLKKESEKIDAQAERFGGKKVEKFLRYLGDIYNKQSKWRKIGVGLALGTGIAVGTAGVAVAIPFSSVLVGVSGGALTIQRTLATLGMFNRFEKHLDEVHEGSRKGYFANKKVYQFLANQPEIVRSGAALAMAAGYGVVSREVIGGAAHIVGNYVGDWLAHYFETPPETNASLNEAVPNADTLSAGQPLVPPDLASHLEGNVSPVDNLPNIETSAETNASLNEAVPNADALSVGQPLVPEVMPSVSASPGHGYEWMAKRLWERMHATGGHFVLPENTDPNSDLARLYNASGDSINKVVHQLASTDTGHGFYHADGTSVIISEHARMTIGADNAIHISDATHPDIVEAPVGAPTTPIYPQEITEVNVPNADTLSAGQPLVSPDLASHLEGNVSPVDNLPNIETSTETNASLNIQAETQPASTLDSLSHTTAPAVENHLQPNNSVDTNNLPSHSPEHTPEVTPESIAKLPQYPGVFSNQLNLEIDPTQGHIFEDTSGAKVAFGNVFKDRFEAAEAYVQAHHDAVVWVQSNKLLPDITDKNILRPYAFPIRWGGPLRGVEVPLPSFENPGSFEIGIIEPNSFVKELP